MSIEKRPLYHQLLGCRYTLTFLGRGIRRLAGDLTLLLITLAGVILVSLVMMLLPAIWDGPLAVVITKLYTLALLCLSVFVLLLWLWWLGTPKGFLNISACLTKLSLVNAAGELPILLSRSPSDRSARGEVWEFESYGVPMSAFLDATEQLESALDIALVLAREGQDGRKVLLEVVPHPGPWPKVLQWSLDKMPDGPSVVALGENRGEQLWQDFSVTPHLLIAGQTGSGKSVLVKNLMMQCLHKGWQVYLVDYKRGADYGRKWREVCTLVVDDGPLIETLDMLTQEMERRLRLFAEWDSPNIADYIRKSGQEMERICLCFDEVAECLDKTALTKEEKEAKATIEKRLSTLARLSRAAGIHLILSTQRGSSDVLPGQVRSNIQAICGIANENLSLLTLGTADAHKRIPKDARGRFLMDDGTMFQGYYFESLDFFDIRQIDLLEEWL